MNNQGRCLAATAALVLVAGAVPAAAGLKEALAEANADFDVRYRLEAVDQEGIHEQARASTARARLSWSTTPTEAFSVGVEADYVFTVGTERYNSTDNGRAQFPVVDLNQAFVRYRGESLTVTAGRQRIGHAEQRFVGSVAWRQNEQTYDALRVQSAVGRVGLDYSYVGNVNRVFGPDDGAQPGDWRGNSHFLRASFAATEAHSVSAFSYMLDFENDNGPVNSNATYGIEYRGAFGPFTALAAIGRQSDWGDNPVSYEAPYYLLEGRWQGNGTGLAVGHEVLGSDSGRAGFRTPLATLHKFQGWSDKLLVTPPDGVRDTYLRGSTRVGPFTVAAALHDFSAAEGGAEYGREADISMAYSWRNVAMQLKLARYRARELASDTTKAWLVMGYAF